MVHTHGSGKPATQSVPVICATSLQSGYSSKAYLPLSISCVWGDGRSWVGLSERGLTRLPDTRGASDGKVIECQGRDCF